MKRTYSFTFLMGVLLIMAVAPLQAKPLRVVTTTTDLKSIVEAVGGDHVTVSSISNGRQDPHYIAAKPSYMLMLRKADLFIRIGLELERGWENLVLEGSRNRRIQPGSPGHLDASQGIERQEVPTGTVDRSLGDVHPLGNPHYWLDPYNARVMAATIAERLGNLDPGNSDDYRAAAAAFILKVDQAMFGAAAVADSNPEDLWRRQTEGELEISGGGWYARLAAFRGAEVVTYHRSWTYFLRRFGLVSVGELEAKPGISPSPGHLKSLIATIREKQVPVLIVASFKGKRAPNLVVSKTGIKLVKVPYSTGGSDEAGNYIAMIDNLVNKVAAALSAEEAE